MFGPFSHFHMFKYVTAYVEGLRGSRLNIACFPSFPMRQGCITGGKHLSLLQGLGSCFCISLIVIGVVIYCLFLRYYEK